MILQQLLKPWSLSMLAVVFAIVVTNMVSPPWRYTAIERMKEAGVPVRIAYDPEVAKKATGDGVHALVQISVEAHQRDFDDRNSGQLLSPDRVIEVFETGVADGAFLNEIQRYLSQREDLLVRLHHLDQFDTPPYSILDHEEVLPYNYIGVQTTEIWKLLRLAAFYGRRTDDFELSMDAIESAVNIARVFRGGAEPMQQGRAGTAAAMAIEAIMDLLEARPLMPDQRARVASAVASIRDVLDDYRLPRTFIYLPDAIQAIQDPWGRDTNGFRDPTARWITNGIEMTAGVDLHAILSLSLFVDHIRRTANATLSETDAQPWRLYRHSKSVRRLGGAGDFFQSMYVQGYKNELIRNLRLEAIASALAVEAFRDQNAELPESLADLVPQYLSAVPTINCKVVEWQWPNGPFGIETPLVIEHDGAGYRIRTQCRVRPARIVAGHDDRIRRREYNPDQHGAPPDPDHLSYLVDLRVTS